MIRKLLGDVVRAGLLIVEDAIDRLSDPYDRADREKHVAYLNRMLDEAYARITSLDAECESYESIIGLKDMEIERLRQQINDLPPSLPVPPLPLLIDGDANRQRPCLKSRVEGFFCMNAEGHFGPCNTRPVDDCQCGRSFRTGEDYRDHLPCEKGRNYIPCRRHAGCLYFDGHFGRCCDRAGA